MSRKEGKREKKAKEKRKEVPQTTKIHTFLETKARGGKERERTLPSIFGD
jgi:hypothetical protein